MSDLGRLITAMITPFDDKGEIDYEEAGHLANSLISSGSDGVIISGTTGESPALSKDEKIRLLSAVKESVGSRCSVIAGTRNNNTQESIVISQLAEKAGADGLLLTVPYYNKPPQQGLYEHFKIIAESVDVPCMLYNVPSRTSTNMTDETTTRLSHIENIVGVKEASSDMAQICRVIENSKPGFKVWSGNDDETFHIMSMGGYGVVSVLSHLVGTQIKNMMGMILEGDIETAAAEHRRLFNIFKIMFSVSNPIPVKHFVNQAGFNVGKPRLPLVSLTEEEMSVIGAVVAEYDIDIKP